MRHEDFWIDTLKTRYLLGLNNIDAYHLYMSLFPSVCLSFCLSIVHHISGTLHYVMIIFGTHVESDNISRSFLLFLILIYWAVRGVKG